MTAEEAYDAIRETLAMSPDLRKHDHPHPLGEHCYVASEALWHGWLRAEGTVHWFLKRGHEIVDPTREQFKSQPPYECAVGRGFLPVKDGKPSRRARILLDRIGVQLA